ncbi:hypothetical protein ATE67_18695 [Sphingopyxis sp. H050]|nr:hypothetical protein ATE67_18695 [Sphingopyxis sp. H050]
MFGTYRKGDSAVVTDPDILATGFVALDVIWRPGRKGASLAAGGSCGNVAATLASFGNDVALVAKLGADAEAAAVIDDLVRAGVRPHLLRRDSRTETPVVIHEILEGPRDHRFLLNDPETGARLPRYSPPDPLDIHAAKLLAPKVFYFDRLSPGIIDLARQLKENGAITFFEPSDISGDISMTDVEPFVDILKISAQRAHEFGGRLRYSSPIQILTDGRRGLDVRLGGAEDSEFHHLPAVLIEGVVDSAGAGDAVSSALIAAILDDWTGEIPTPDLALYGLRRGQVLAALNCRFAGARGALQSLGVEVVTTVLDEAMRANAPSYQHELFCREPSDILGPNAHLTKLSERYSAQ